MEDRKIEIVSSNLPRIEFGGKSLSGGRFVTIRSKGPIELRVDLELVIRGWWEDVDRTDIDTFSGGKLDFLNLSAKDINLDDIAVGLSNTCRFAGQIDEFYSVAEHSVLVSRVLESRLNAPLPGIVESTFAHDFPEAYAHDIVSPLKKLCPGYKLIERDLEVVIMEAFGLGISLSHPMIKEVDMDVFHAERKLFMNPPECEGEYDLPDGLCIRNLSPKEARKEFYERAEELGVRIRHQ